MFNINEGFRSENNEGFSVIVSELDREGVSRVEFEPNTMSHVTSMHGTRGSNYDYHRSNVSDEDDQSPNNPSASSEFRTIILNENQAQKYKNNKISTAKYTPITFIPRFLFEQFRRYANIFFLCIGLLQQIPGVSPTGKYVTIVPFLIILAATAAKEIYEDLKRHKADRKVNHSKVKVLTSDGKTTKKKWRDVCVGDILIVEKSSFFPADLVLLSSSEPQGMCYVETSNLDGETNLKIRSSLPVTSEYTSESDLSKLVGVLEAELPNNKLYDFNGRLRPPSRQVGSSGISVSQDVVPLNADQLLLRGARLRNTNWVAGLVVYTGHESKLMMNSTKTPLKRSSIDLMTNYQIVFLFLILVALALISSIGNQIMLSSDEDHAYFRPSGNDIYTGFFWKFITFFILYNNLVPISLQVTLELVKVGQAYFINNDEEMHYIDKENNIDAYATARTSNLNEQLGMIKYVFSDKTGTLTRNVMEYKKCSIAGHIYDPDRKKRPVLTHKDLVDNLRQGHNSPDVIREFLTLLTVCHTVIPEEGEDGVIKYNAASPDEKALVEGAEVYGYKFVARKPESVMIKTHDDETEEYQVLNVIEFTSARKRMSIIVRTTSGEIKLFIKGADSVILERLGDSREQRKYYDETIQHLEEFARDGFRTLCLAVATLSESEYNNWNTKWKAASASLTDREGQIESVATLIETNLTLIGATAIEDKLQEKVPETIASLLEANIHVWMLTGDKQETAINIAKSCQLHTDNSDLFIINSTSPEDAKEDINEQLETLRKDNLIGKDNDITIVVDGKSLNYALLPDQRKDFIDLCTSCKAVVCCRVSPIQKAEVVQLVKEHTGAITLSIGDGANDVAMIQKASVGVGISGNEGLQAANSADFAIAQFRYLSRLLFVHGAWNYSRVSKVILYSFYKNITLYIIELWFAIYNYWSGQVVYERWTIGFYNIFFTSLSPLALGLSDRTCTDKVREKYPSLYQRSQNAELFNIKEFWKWILLAIYHSIFLFWMPLGATMVGTEWGHGKTDDYLLLGNIVYSLVVITTNLKAGLEMDAWTYLCHISIWGSILLWFFFLLVYSHVWQVSYYGANMVYMFEMIFTTPVWWFCLLMVPVLTLLADIAYKAVRTTIFMTETEKIRIAEVKMIEESVYVESGRRPITSETSRLLDNVTNRLRRNKQRQEQLASVELDARHGYAYSHEEGGCVGQEELIRRYDTTSRPRGMQA